MSDKEIPFLFGGNKPDDWGLKFRWTRTYNIPEITPEVKSRFLRQVILTPDDIQESVEADDFFQHDAMLKWQLRAFIEWQRSPCIEHHPNNPEMSHELCLTCRRIAWEALK